MKIYEVQFKGVYPVGNCLIIAAKNHKKAFTMAQNTIAHTKEIKVTEVDITKPTVIVYLNGDY